MAKTMPRQQPGRSKQDVRTPSDFLAAARSLLGIEAFTVDLAATRENTVAPKFYSVRANALVQPWALGGWNWLNPEYSDIAPWVKKAYEEKLKGAQTAVLIPAGVGANWWRDHVHGRAHVLLLNGRITFVGHHQPYPKDCALLIYAKAWPAEYDCWSWAAKQKAAA
jgi:phage N-6-adenine-methyltransferase